MLKSLDILEHIKAIRGAKLDARRKSSGNTLKSLEILENLTAICGANLATIIGNRLKIDWDILTYWEIFGIVSPSLEDHRKCSGHLLPHRGSSV